MRNESVWNLRWTLKDRKDVVGSHGGWEERDARLGGSTESRGAGRERAVWGKREADSVWRKSGKGGS